MKYLFFTHLLAAALLHFLPLEHFVLLILPLCGLHVLHVLLLQLLRPILRHLFSLVSCFCRVMQLEFLYEDRHLFLLLMVSLLDLILSDFKVLSGS